jgi:predicted PurR-regulated permease PerM
MLGLDRGAARAAWTVLLMATAVALLYLIRGTLLLFVAALMVAYLLAPLVDLVDRLAARRVPRTLSLAVVYVLLLAVIITGASFTVSRIVDEAGALAIKLPEYLKTLDAPRELPIPASLKPIQAELHAALRAQIEAVANEIVPLMRRAGLQALAALGNLGYVILVPILSFFFLKDARSIRQALADQIVDPARRALVDDLFSDVNVLLAQFMRAVLLLALATFVCYGIFLELAGVPYALLLAGVAGVMEIIPVLGPLAASAIILLVAGFAGYPHLLWILIFLGVYRLFQDYVLQPYLMSSEVALHPVLVIFGVLAGEQVGGVAGMFLSIPALATLRVIYVRLMKWYRARQEAAL